jgi:glycosyltransferase involved in cell wall biosynthesis
MRIVHVADYFMPRFGYQESILPRYHARHGHDVHVVTSDRYTNVPHYESSWKPLLGERMVGVGVEEHDGVTIHRLAGSLERRDRIFMKGLQRTLNEIQPDAIFGHGTTNYTAFRLARSARRLGVPLFLDCHMLYTVQDQSATGKVFYRAVRCATAHFMTPMVTRYFGVAEESCDFLVEAQGIPAEKVSLLPLGLDTGLFSPRPESGTAVRNKHGVPADAVLVMQTGKLTPDKGPHLLAEALAPLMATDPRIHLMLVGGGSPEYTARILAPFDDPQVRGRVIQAPLVPVDELAGYFTAADIVAFAAGSSLSCIEAAGCGAVVVMTDLPAGRWRADHGVGVTFPDGDVAGLRAVLRELTADPDQRAALSEKAQLAVIETFSYDRVARDLEAQMEQAAAR